MSRRSRRWHECLAILKPENELPPERLKFAFRNGWKMHSAIQADFPGLHSEQLSTFSDPSLPFSIGYHPDMWDGERGIVYEIKPQGWFYDHRPYCEAQLAGYCHFKQARGVFLLYTKGGYAGLAPRRLPSWDELRAIALKSDAILLEKGL